MHGADLQECDKPTPVTHHARRVQWRERLGLEGLGLEGLEGLGLEGLEGLGWEGTRTR